MSATVPESARPGPGERAEQDEQRAVREAWHDVACVEGLDCRDRSLHAMGQPLATSGVLAKFLNRLAELRPPSASPAATEAETGEQPYQCAATWPPHPAQGAAFACCLLGWHHSGQHVRGDGARWGDGTQLLEDVSPAPAVVDRDRLDRAEAERDFILARITYKGPDRCTGISSDALALYALCPNAPEPLTRQYPADRSDLAACQRTYDMAPEHLQTRIRPVLGKYRKWLGVQVPDSESGDGSG